MMDKKTYKKEIVRMWDSLRDRENKGLAECDGVENCKECAMSENCNRDEGSVISLMNAFEHIEAIEKWSKENPQKYKISPFEYEYLKLYQKYGFGSDRLCDLTGTTILHAILHELFYLKDIDLNVKIEDILLNCEVEEDDG